MSWWERERVGGKGTTTSLTTSSARVTGSLTYTHVLGLVVGVVARLPGVLGSGGVLGNTGGSVLEENLLDKVQLFDVFNNIFVILYGLDLGLILCDYQSG